MQYHRKIAWGVGHMSNRGGGHMSNKVEEDIAATPAHFPLPFLRAIYRFITHLRLPIYKAIREGQARRRTEGPREGGWGGHRANCRVITQDIKSLYASGQRHTPAEFRGEPVLLRV